MSLFATLSYLFLQFLAHITAIILSLPVSVSIYRTIVRPLQLLKRRILTSHQLPSFPSLQPEHFQHIILLLVLLSSLEFFNKFYISLNCSKSSSMELIFSLCYSISLNPLLLDSSSLPYFSSHRNKAIKLTSTLSLLLLIYPIRFLS
jgi:hypothetical protein